MPEQAILHVCPHCDRVFDSPSLCVEGNVPTEPRLTTVTKEQHRALMDRADRDYFVTMAEAELTALRAEVERLQAAVDTAHGAWTASQYVGGPTEREAYRTAMDALGAVVTHHKGTDRVAPSTAPEPSA